MIWLFVLLIATLTASDVLGRDFGLGPGLSVKNALLYVIALALFFRIALTGQARMRLPVLHLCFGLWIGYAILSFVACSLVIHYPGYNVLQSGIALKSQLVDPALFFFTVFYGVRQRSDATLLWKALAIAVGVANLLTLTDVAGITRFGVRIGTTGAEADRVFGVFGHANETGALIVTLMPLLVAVALGARSWGRIVWWGAAGASFAVLILTVSRGAFVALAIGYLWAIWLCRRYLPLPKVAAWVLIGATTTIGVIAVASLIEPHVGETVSNRLFGHSGAVDLDDVSSGRTNIWANTIGHMIATPITLLTGFGWNVYDTRFIYVTHNYYLDLWFNLGLVGLLCLVVILQRSVSTGRRAVDLATPDARAQMIAFVFGAITLAVAIFFTNLSRPWPYVWMYFGVSLRSAAELLATAQRERPRSARRADAVGPVVPAAVAVPRAAGGLRGARAGAAEA